MNGKRKLRNLCPDEVDKVIESLPESTRVKVKRNVVDNFLTTVAANDDRVTAIANMFADAKAYGWNIPTQDAIAIGIEFASESSRSVA
jgi:hypothetical protein